MTNRCREHQINSSIGNTLLYDEFLDTWKQYIVYNTASSLVVEGARVPGICQSLLEKLGIDFQRALGIYTLDLQGGG